MYTKNTHPLFDALIEEKKLVNDAGLARALGLAPPVISKIRNGKMEIGDTMRVNIMRRFKMSLLRLDDLAPPGSATAGAPENAEE